MARVALCVLVFFSFLHGVQAQSSIDSQPLDELGAQLRARVMGTGGLGMGTDAARRLGFESYNLGTRYLTDGQPGAAHAWLALASQFLPNDPDTQRNRDIAKRQLEARVGKEGVFLGRNPWEAVVSTSTATSMVKLLGLLLLFISFGNLVLRNKKRADDAPVTPRRLLAFFRPTPMVLTGLGAGVLLLVSSKWMSIDSAGIEAALIGQATVRSGPADSFVNLAELPQGAVIPVLQVRRSGPGAAGERWIQVRYAPSKLGWIPESTCLPLSKHWP